MKRFRIKLLACCLGALTMCMAVLGGCSSSGSTAGGNIVYPDYPNTPSEKNSWEYIEEEFTIDWFVGISGFTDFTWGGNTVTKQIQQKLGVNINFITTTENYDSYLSSLISADNCPDVVTIGFASSTAKQMITQGYAYPIDGLAERWAPSLQSKLQADYLDVLNYFTANFENLYFLPSHSWADKDEEYINDMMPNGAIMIREDLLNWFTNKNPNVDVMTSEGFYSMLKEVQETFGYTSGLGGSVDGIPKVQYLRSLELAKITDASNSAVEYLSEYFAAPYEDEKGNYIDKRLTPQYVEALDFLNRAYNDGLISEANMTETSDDCGMAISSGKVFCFIGKPQDYTNNFQVARDAYGYNYVPLIVTNAEGEDPILQSEQKYAYCYNMITTAAERPDLIVKLFDYLWSDEGQLMTIFGEEGVAWNWTDDTHNKITCTEDYVQNKAEWNDDWLSYGAYSFWFLERSSFYRKVRPDNLWTKNEIYKANFRLPLQPIAYSYIYMFTDCYSIGDRSMTMIANNAEAYWQNNIVSILTAGRDNFQSVYDSVITSMRSYGWDDLLSYYNGMFKNVKQKMGVTYAWPLNDPAFQSKIKDSAGNYLLGPTGKPELKIQFEPIDA